MKTKFKTKIIRLPTFLSEPESTELNCCLFPPLGLGQIVSYIKSKGIDIEQDDLHIHINYNNYYCKNSNYNVNPEIFYDENRCLNSARSGNDFEINSILNKLAQGCKFAGYDVILLSLLENRKNLSNMLFALCLLRFLKETYNPIIIIGGYPLAIELLLYKYKTPHIDFHVRRDGLEALFRLLSAIKENKNPRDIPDLRFDPDGRSVSLEAKYIPLANFEGLPLEKYKFRGLDFNYKGNISKIISKFNKSKTLIIPFKFIKGCPFQCIFCCSSGEELQYAMPPQQVALHLEELQRKYKPTGFFFLSDTINISLKYINELCDAIIERNLKIRWTDCARADCLDRQTLFKMRKAGCIRLIYGLETASERLLNYINKRIDIKRLENILKWTHEAGIWSGVEFIAGLPFEKQEDCDQSLAFIEKNKQYIDRIYCNPFGLRDGSKLVLTPEKYGLCNVQEIHDLGSDDHDAYNRGYNKYSFDEIGGLPWQEKKKQILDSFRPYLYISTVFPTYEDEHFLFFLYSILDDKNQIRNFFQEAGRQKAKKLCG